VQALRRGKKILVIDQPASNNTSRVAAGLFNPVTGKKMVKTWLADTLFPYLHTYYRSLEEETSKYFFHPMPLYRPFISIEEQNEWMARSAEPAYQHYVDKVLTIPSVPQVHDPYGGLWLKQCGFLDTRAYVDIVRALIQRDGFYEDAVFEEKDLLPDADGVTYRDVRASKIILCQGIRGNAWFQHLPVRPLKGETITVQSDFREEVVVNRGVYVVPAREEGKWRVGATYNFQDHEPGVTEPAKNELTEKLNELVQFPFEVCGQDWGFRPTTPDRRPMLGAHRDHPSIIIFNGLGTKGVSLAPYFSDVLLRWIENYSPLDKLVDIGRYKSVY
jgi:glycine/D-amino acid oxidase-like deaminating enzyme